MVSVEAETCCDKIMIEINVEAWSVIDKNMEITNKMHQFCIF